MKRQLTITFTFLLGVVLSSCGHAPDQKGGREITPKVLKVKVETARVQEAKQTFQASGTIRSFTIAPLSSKVMGTILEVRVRIGDRVKVGQVLIVVDSRETEAMVQKSEAGIQEGRMALKEVEKNREAALANLQLASTTFKRYQELFEQKSVSPQEFDEIQARQRAAAASVEALRAKEEQVLAKIQQAQADVQSSKALRSYTQISAPLSGVVAQRLAEPGSLAVPGMPLLTVEETGRYRLEVPVEEIRISHIKTGQSIPVRIEALGPSELQGTVSEIQPSADPASRTYLVKISLPSRKELLSGMYGEALFDIGLHQGIWVQSQSIVRQGQLEGIFVLEGEHLVRLRLVKVGEQTAKGVEVLSGMEGNESYVVQGLEALQDGSRVEVMK